MGHAINQDKNAVQGAKQDRYTSIKVRLHPTEEQAALFEKTFGCCRYLWNQMLSDEQEFYAATGQHFVPTPAKYKKGAPFLKEVDSQALVSVTAFATIVGTPGNSDTNTVTSEGPPARRPYHRCSADCRLEPVQYVFRHFRHDSGNGRQQIRVSEQQQGH